MMIVIIIIIIIIIIIRSDKDKKLEKGEELECLLSTVKQFSDDIGIEFGLNKCAKGTFRKGKIRAQLLLN